MRPHAKLAEVITNTRTAVSDAAYTALVTDRMVAYTALTAARVITLPASSAYPTGTRLVIIDESGNCSVTKTLTLNAAGADTINGAASAVVNQAYGFIGLESNETGHWTIIDQGFMPALANIAAAAHGANIQAQVIEQIVTLVRRFGDRIGSDPSQLHRPRRRRARDDGHHWRDLLRGRSRGNLSQFGSALGDRGWLVEFRSDRADRFLQQDESDHHGGRRLVHGRSGPPVDLRSFSRILPPRSGFLFPIGSEMKRILLGAAGAAGLLFGVPACAQTYQDSGGTYVRGVVPIQPGVGPLFTNSNPGKISGYVHSFAWRLSADAGLCAALRRGDIVARAASERNGRHRLQHGRKRGLCDAWRLDRHRDSGQRRHPGRRLDGVHRGPEHISRRD